jgi:hypothetical protein
MVEVVDLPPADHAAACRPTCSRMLMRMLLPAVCMGGVKAMPAWTMVSWTDETHLRRDFRHGREGATCA